MLLQYDDPDGRHPWLHWKTWLEVERIADLKPAGTLSFSGYEQIIPAAVAGHGVALGRSPLVKDLIARRRAGRAVQEPGRPGARLLRDRFEERGGPAGGGGVRRVAEGGSC